MAMSGIPDIKDFKGLVTSGGDALISLGGAAVINAVFGNVWGLVNEFGVPVLKSDNVLGLKASLAQAQLLMLLSNVVCLHPYNKVATPSQAVVQLQKGTGGALSAALAFNLLRGEFHVISPEFVHRNMSIINVDYARSARIGCSMEEQLAFQIP